MLNSNTCLITGGAGGIGRALGLGLAKQGASLVFVDVDEAGADAVAAELRAGGHRAVAVQADVADRSAMDKAADAALDAFGTLDVVFNNAGIPAFSPLDDIRYDLFERVMRINVFGVITGTQAAAAVMRTRGGGKIVNMCSIAGKRGFPNSSVYSASKFAVRALTLAHAQELGPHGITVNAICPGMVETALWDAVRDEHAKRGRTLSSEDLVRSRNETIVLGRHAQPDDLVGIATFLASGASDYMTGQCINVDGGMVLE